jgi:hypothetical protein
MNNANRVVRTGAEQVSNQSILLITPRLQLQGCFQYQSIGNELAAANVLQSYSLKFFSKQFGSKGAQTAAEHVREPGLSVSQETKSLTASSVVCGDLKSAASTAARAPEHPVAHGGISINLIECIIQMGHGCS